VFLVVVNRGEIGATVNQISPLPSWWLAIVQLPQLLTANDTRPGRLDFAMPVNRTTAGFVPLMHSGCAR
jgi:hypothetical protein